MEELNKSIDWWEAKRVYYSIIVVLASFLSFVNFNNSVTYEGNILFDILIWVFGANVFYTMSWATEILIYRRKSQIVIHKNLRRGLFILGYLFSFF